MIDARLLVALLLAVTAHKGALTLGVDKRGYGYTVGVWIGGHKVLDKFYRPEEAGREVLHTELETFTSELWAALDE